MLSLHVTPRQEDLARALVACGYFGNVSEVGRVAIENLVAGLGAARRGRLATHLYREGRLDLLGFADVAGVDVREARGLVEPGRPKVRARPPASALAVLRRRLAGDRLAERFLHLAAYADEPAERSLALGLELTDAAHRARRRGGP